MNQVLYVSTTNLMGFSKSEVQLAIDIAWPLAIKGTSLRQNIAGRGARSWQCFFPSVLRQLTYPLKFKV